MANGSGARPRAARASLCDRPEAIRAARRSAAPLCARCFARTAVASSLDDSRQHPQCLIDVLGSWKHPRNLWIERDHERALLLTSRGLIRTWSTEIIFPQNFVRVRL